MFVALQTTHAGLVHLHCARHRGAMPTNGISDLVQHVPGRLLGNIQVPMQFHRRHALQTRRQQIDRNRPLLQRHMRVGQQCAVTEREMLAAIAAPVRQRLAACNLVSVGAAAAVAHRDTGFPDDRLKPLACRGLVRKFCYLRCTGRRSDLTELGRFTRLLSTKFLSTENPIDAIGRKTIGIFGQLKVDARLYPKNNLRI